MVFPHPNGGGIADRSKEFSVVDDHTFKITLDAANKLTMPDLTVPVPDIMNSKLALAHATPRTPGR